MPLDTSIPLQAKAPSFDDALKPISSMLAIKGQMQAQQRGQQEIDSAGIDLGEKQRMQQLLANPQQFMDGSGNFDWNKLTPAVMQAAPVNGPKYVQQIFQTQQQATQAQSAINSLDADKRAQVGQYVTALVGKPPAEITNALNGLKQSFPNLAPAIDHFSQNILTPAMKAGNQDAVNKALWQAGRSISPPPVQQDMLTPGGVQTNNNQQTAVISTKPGTDVAPGTAVPGTTQQLQLPPTTPTINPSNNQPGYLGPQPQPGAISEDMLDRLRHTESSGNPFAINKDTKAMGPYQFTPETVAMLQQRGLKFNPFDEKEARNAARVYLQQLAAQNGGDINKALAAYGGFKTKDPSKYIGAVNPGGNPPGFVPSGPAPGANESRAGSVQTVNQHWDNLNKQVENSQLLEGLLGNIKALAPHAITGTESGRKAYVAGLLNALHLGDKATGDLQKDTDLLEKNIAQLGLNTPASTDAMRTIVGLARPHSTMHEGAIEEAASQLEGQVKSIRTIRNALTVPKSILNQSGDPTAYEQARQHIEGMADPRAWQFMSLSPEGKKSMLSKLTPEDRAALRTKIQSLEQAGLLK